jgi:hypothetical protein
MTGIEFKGERGTSTTEVVSIERGARELAKDRPATWKLGLQSANASPGYKGR